MMDHPPLPRSFGVKRLFTLALTVHSQQFVRSIPNSCVYYIVPIVQPTVDNAGTLMALRKNAYIAQGM